MPTIPRVFKMTSSAKLNDITPVAGQIIALYDTDAVYYDVPQDGTENSAPERRKVSGVRVVNTLPDAGSAMFDIIYVYVPTDEDAEKMPDGSPVYELRVRVDDGEGAHLVLVGTNRNDVNVTTDLAGTTIPFYLTGSTSDESVTGTLVKSAWLYATVADNKVTLHADVFDGTVAQASRARTADSATRADEDNNGNAIVTYFREISDSEPSTGGTKITFIRGNGEDPYTVTTKDTTYSRFGEGDDLGLVPGYGSQQPSDVILKGNGWVTVEDIGIGTAQKAIGDKNNKDITSYLASAAVNQNNQLIFTDGAGNLQPPIPFPTYSVFDDNTNGLVPAPTSANRDKFLKGDHTWSAIPNYVPGTAGLVPPASTGATNQYLDVSGIWKGVFTPATDSVNGSVGLVPAPTTSDVNGVLGNNGWVVNGTGSSADPNTTTPTYLVGAKSQSATATQTYSNSGVFMVDGKLYQRDGSTSSQVVDLTSSQVLSNKQVSIDGNAYAFGTACSYTATDTVAQSYDDEFTGDGTKLEFTLTHVATDISLVTINDTPVAAADYSLGDGNNSIIFVSAPSNGASIVVTYISVPDDTIPTSEGVYKHVAESIGDLVGIADSKVDSQVIAGIYNTDTSGYSVGDYCMYQSETEDSAKLYRCRQSVLQNDSFDPDKWIETTVMQEILNLLNPNP